MLEAAHDLGRAGAAACHVHWQQAHVPVGPCPARSACWAAWLAVAGREPVAAALTLHSCRAHTAVRSCEGGRCHLC